jgi:methyl-accepting chemotaxis protein
MSIKELLERVNIIINQNNDLNDKITNIIYEQNEMIKDISLKVDNAINDINNINDNINDLHETTDEIKELVDETNDNVNAIIDIERNLNTINKLQRIKDTLKKHEKIIKIDL